MRKKKSYLNKNNILSEGFFDKLLNVLRLDSKTKNKIKSNSKLKNDVKSLNKTVDDMEKIFSDLYGIDVNLKKYQLSDFD